MFNLAPLKRQGLDKKFVPKDIDVDFEASCIHESLRTNQNDIQEPQPPSEEDRKRFSHLDKDVQVFFGRTYGFECGF